MRGRSETGGAAGSISLGYERSPAIFAWQEKLGSIDNHLRTDIQGERNRADAVYYDIWTIAHTRKCYTAYDIHG